MKQRCRFIIAGNVDDGKSTLTGRLLLDSNNIKDDILYKTQKDDSLNLAHITDGLKNERLQGITIDVAYQYFTYNNTAFTLIDAPGHKEYTKNMISGASNADIIIVLIDVNLGITEQTKRHTFLAHLLKIPHLVVAINKMDAVSYAEEHFNTIKTAFKEFTENLTFKSIEYIPISGLVGDNVIKKSKNTLWYQNNSIIDALEAKASYKNTNNTEDLVSVQFSLTKNNRVFYYANAFNGTLKKNKSYFLLPQKETITLTDVFDRCSGNDQKQLVFNVSENEEKDIEVGNILVNSIDNFGIKNNASAVLIWLSDDELVLNSFNYTLKIQHQEVVCNILTITKELNIEKLNWGERINGKTTNGIYQINLQTNTNFVYDNNSNENPYNRGIIICNTSKRTIGIILNLK